MKRSSEGDLKKNLKKGTAAIKTTTLYKLFKEIFSGRQKEKMKNAASRETSNLTALKSRLTFAGEDSSIRFRYPSDPSLLKV